MKISVIVPVYSEEESIPELYDELRTVIDREPWDAEIIMVDDGSADQSAAIIANLAEQDPRVKPVHFARNFGQTAAILAGIDRSEGDVIIPIDTVLHRAHAKPGGRYTGLVPMIVVRPVVVDSCVPYEEGNLEDQCGGDHNACVSLVHRGPWLLETRGCINPTRSGEA